MKCTNCKKFLDKPFKEFTTKGKLSWCGSGGTKPRKIYWCKECFEKVEEMNKRYAEMETAKNLEIRKKVLGY